MVYNSFQLGQSPGIAFQSY